MTEIEDGFDELFGPILPDTTRFSLGYFEILEVDDNIFHDLTGHFEGKSVEIVPRSDHRCLEVVTEKDFDEDGFVDILLWNNEACAGRCCLNPFFVVSYRGNGTYKSSELKGQAYTAPIIERWKGKWSIVVENSPNSVISTAILGNKERFVLEEGELVKVEDILPHELHSDKELRAIAFDSLAETDTLKLWFDLDADGKSDLVWGTYWKHWGRVLWSVKFGNGQVMLDGTPFKRLGVLPTVTEGHYDLVVDVDRVLEWTGKRYEEREE